MLQSAVLDWFEANGRALNFRRTRDPYAVLVSEVIAQQTQIPRVEPAWEAFIARFPDVFALASASTADVLRQWHGLGYNRRALNLQRAARVIVAEHGGRFPETIEALERLPGIGPYTARAVAAIAFGQRVGAVDTNVRRALGRAMLGRDRVEADAELRTIADALVPEGRSADWTHALMDIGALFCRPRAPRCDACPIRQECRFLRDGARATARPRRPQTPFRSTSRWLRGRLLDRARSTPDGAWFRAAEAFGNHSAESAIDAARTMALEGLLELHPTEAGLARLPQ